jgi:hypothetical protein
MIVLVQRLRRRPWNSGIRPGFEVGLERSFPAAWPKSG